MHLKCRKQNDPKRREYSLFMPTETYLFIILLLLRMWKNNCQDLILSASVAVNEGVYESPVTTLKLKPSRCQVYVKISQP